MSKQIIKSINDKNIPLNKCRGQGYDGANTMEGTGGVQKLIKDIEPNAVCVHCAAHNLNLVLNDAVRESEHACARTPPYSDEQHRQQRPLRRPRLGAPAASCPRTHSIACFRSNLARVKCLVGAARPRS
ncbi:hypothetical protein EVAR_63353_1 [Eumeta japonica]|uniref:Zinc finger MYM-type protein 1 n=1 Tax=Eumeta variegata TaxID=151549 RepID=A0A4C2AB77_EUMVA|nr:hypothetical protein EVAR_63353_1 [Eumeta japonica]